MFERSVELSATKSAQIYMPRQVTPHSVPRSGKTSLEVSVRTVLMALVSGPFYWKVSWAMNGSVDVYPIEYESGWKSGSGCQMVYPLARAWRTSDLNNWSHMSGAH